MSVRLPKDEAFRLGIPVPKRASKYKNIPTIYGGIRYDSKAEAERAKWHTLAENEGDYWWVRQVKFRLGCPENVFVVDFLVCDGGKVHCEDVKGFRTKKFNRDVKLWKIYGHVNLYIITGGKIVEIVHPIKS